METRDRVKTEFKIDEKNRVVVCVITAKYDVAIRLCKYGLIDPEIEWKYFNSNIKPCRYVGIAKCAPEDEWDITYGKKLAEYRASEKRMRDVNKKLSAAIEDIENKINNLEEHGYIKISKKPEIIDGTN